MAKRISAKAGGPLSLGWPDVGTEQGDEVEVHPSLRITPHVRGFMVHDDFDEHPSLFRTREAAIAYATDLAKDDGRQ